MKAKRISAEFNPIIITIETQAELEIFATMVGQTRAVDISKSLPPANKLSTEQITEIISGLYISLKSI